RRAVAAMSNNEAVKPCEAAAAIRKIDVQQYCECAAREKALRAEVGRLRADAARYRWLTENCLRSFSMTHDEPAEHALAFEWQQSQLSEAGWSIHDAIDAAMEATNAG